MKNKKDTIVKVFVGEKIDKDNYQTTFFCPFCNVWHSHGHGEGHRAKHCYTDKGEKAFKGGYVLKYHTKKELLEMRKCIDRALKLETWKNKNFK